MRTTVSEGLCRLPQRAREISEAMAILEAEIGPASDQVEAEWNTSRDPQGRERVHLRISDWTGSVEYRFAPEELANGPHLKLRLHRLWGDLLQVRSHVQLDDYLSSLQAQEGH